MIDIYYLKEAQLDYIKNIDISKFDKDTIRNLYYKIFEAEEYYNARKDFIKVVEIMQPGVLYKYHKIKKLYLKTLNRKYIPKEFHSILREYVINGFIEYENYKIKLSLIQSRKNKLKSICL